MLAEYALTQADESTVHPEELSDSLFPQGLLEAVTRFSVEGLQRFLEDRRAQPLLNTSVFWSLRQESTTLLCALPKISFVLPHHTLAYEKLQLLLKAGCDPNVNDSRGGTPLFYAIQNGWLDAATLLAPHTRPECRDCDKKTPLMAAVEFFTVYDLAIPGSTPHEHLPLLEFAGSLSDFNACDVNGRTALMHAANESLALVCEWLASRCPLETATPNGSKALHEAAGASYLDAHKSVDVLLRAGADPNALNAYGQTPFDVAIAVENWACADALGTLCELPRIQEVIQASSPQRYPRSFARMEREVLRKEVQHHNALARATRRSHRSL